MGEIIQRSGISIKSYRALNLWLQRLPGQPLHTNVVACSLFPAISGSSVGTAATMGAVAIFIIAVVYKSLTWEALTESLASAVRSTTEQNPLSPTLIGGHG